MKLIRCYVENFGKLKNQDISFSDGAMCFHYENGWGKSTLAAFLTVMLYGFDNERSRDDYVNERKRYRPWQGGVYGGTLTFSSKGKTYTVERTFGIKEKEDHFRLLDEETNLESTDFSSNLGEELFRLDRDSFTKTILLSQNDCAAKTTDRIQRNLGNLAETTEDIEGYEKADSRLNDLLNGMSPLRKTGSLYRMKEQLSDLEAELRRGEALDREIESLLGDKKKAEEDVSKYREVQEELLKQQMTLFASWEKNLPAEALALSPEIPSYTDRWNRILVAAGILSDIAGGILLFTSKESGITLLLLGAVACMIGSVRYFRQKRFHQNQKEEYDVALLEYREQQQEEVQQRLRKIQYMIENAYRRRIQIEQEMQSKIKKRERLFEKEEQFLLLKEQYDADLLKYERLKMTRQYLAQAKASYLTKYRNPLMQAFLAYYEMISGDSGENLRMDANLELSIQEYGCGHESRYYSAGWKDLMGICMRMALVEVLFKEEKPFLILDDPFVNLDKQKSQAALEFVRAIGEDYQIIYFTCHESRRF